MITKCRNCTIFAGAIQGQLIVRSSYKLTITACCKGMTAVDEEQTSLKPSGSHKLFVSCQTRPVFDCCAVAGDIASYATLAPCNRWYKGMLADLKTINHTMTSALLNSPLLVPGPLSTHHLVPPLPVNNFFLTEIPFDVVVTDSPRESVAKAAESYSLPQSIDTADEFKALLNHLPPTFATWIQASSVYGSSLQVLMDQAREVDPNFSLHIQKQFETWLENSQKFSSVQNLFKMRSDVLERE